MIKRIFVFFALLLLSTNIATSESWRDADCVVITYNHESFIQSGIQPPPLSNNICILSPDWKQLDPNIPPRGTDSATTPEAPVGLAEFWQELKQIVAAEKTILFHLPPWSFTSVYGPGIRMREIISYLIGIAEATNIKHRFFVAWEDGTNNTGWFAVHQSLHVNEQFSNYATKAPLIFRSSVTDEEISEIARNEKLKHFGQFSKKPTFKKIDSGTYILTTHPYLNCLGCNKPFYMNKEVFPQVNIFLAGPTEHRGNKEQASYRYAIAKKLAEALENKDEPFTLGLFIPEYLTGPTGGFYNLRAPYKDFPVEGLTQISWENLAMEKSDIIFLSLDVKWTGNIGVTLRNEAGSLFGKFTTPSLSKQKLVLFRPAHAHCMEAIDLFIADAVQAGVVSDFDNLDLSKKIFILTKEEQIIPVLSRLAMKADEEN